MNNNEQLPQLNTLAKYNVQDLVCTIIDRSDLYRVFEHVEHRQLELLADLALEELRIRALSGELNPRAPAPTPVPTSPGRIIRAPPGRIIHE